MFLKSIDRHGRPFVLQIDGGDTYRTIAGGIVTILYFLAWAFLVCYLGKNIYFRSNPTFLYKKNSK